MRDGRSIKEDGTITIGEMLGTSTFSRENSWQKLLANIFNISTHSRIAKNPQCL